MTHGFSSDDKSKKPMNMYYDFTTGKIYAYDSNEILQEVEIGEGSGMTNLIGIKDKDNLTYFQGAYGAASCILSHGFKISVSGYGYAGGDYGWSRPLTCACAYAATGNTNVITTDYRGSGNHQFTSPNNWGTEFDVVVDLLRPKKVERVEIVDGSLGNRNKTIYTVQLQCSDNNSTWSNASESFDKVETSSSSTDYDKAIFSLECTDSTKHRYWRLHYTRSTNVANELAGFSQFALIGYDE